MEPDLPVGPLLPERSAPPPARRVYKGRIVILRPVDPEADCQALFAASHGSPAHGRIWTYMGYGPFQDPPAMRAWLVEMSEKTDPLFLTVCDRRSGAPLGMTSFLNVHPAMRRLEVGHIWYGLAAQRTKVNTEAIYLMLRSAFEEWSYRRVEWKCDALNSRSRAAAERLGFRYEGLFRQHMIVKGRSRDTAWFAMLDHEWPVLQPVIDHWLYEEDGTSSLGAQTRAVLSRTG